MKKFSIYLSVFASVLLVYKANAQQGFSLSVKGIPQFSLMENKDDNNNSSYTKKASFNGSFGLGAGYNFNQHFGAGIDVLYSLQGQRYTFNGLEYNQKNDYFKLPVYFTYNTNPLKNVSFTGSLGPQVSFLTSSKLDDKNGHIIISNTKDKYKNTMFGAVVSAGAQYKLKSNLYLSTVWRFDYDFTNAEDDQYADYVSGRAKTHNITNGLEVGLKYVLKR